MSNTRPRLSRSFGNIVVETPYDAHFVDAIKSCIPKTARAYDKGMWIVNVGYYSCLVTLMQHFWGNKFIDSVSGVAEPQTNSWKESWAVWQGLKNKEFKRTEEYTKADSGSTWNLSGTTAPVSAFLTLYVTGNAPKEVIKAAYRALAKMHHPDNGGDTEVMARINAAYQALEKAGKV